MASCLFCFCFCFFKRSRKFRFFCMISWLLTYLLISFLNILRPHVYHRDSPGGPTVCHTYFTAITSNFFFFLMVYFYSRRKSTVLCWCVLIWYMQTKILHTLLNTHKWEIEIYELINHNKSSTRTDHCISSRKGLHASLADIYFGEFFQLQITDSGKYLVVKCSI